MTVAAVLSDREDNVVSRFTFIINRAGPAGRKMFANGAQAAIAGFHDYNPDKVYSITPSVCLTNC